MTSALLVLLALASAVAVVLFIRLRKTVGERDGLQAEQSRLVERFRGVADAEAERARVLGILENERMAARMQSEKDRAAGEAERARALAELEKERVAVQEQLERQRAASAERLADVQRKIQAGSTELTDLQAWIQALRTEFDRLDEGTDLQSFGFYEPHYEFADSERYQSELERIRDAQKRMLKDKAAAICYVERTVDGSKVEGRKPIIQTIKLMLRAFNGECDAAIAKVRDHNVHVMEARINRAYEAINGLTGAQRCEITAPYLNLKLQELYLVHEYREKRQEEKDEREEEIA